MKEFDLNGRRIGRLFIGWITKSYEPAMPRKAYTRGKKSTWPCGMRRTKKNTMTFANGREVCKHHYDKYLEKKKAERAAKGGKK